MMEKSESDIRYVPLPSPFKEKAEKELGETEEVAIEAIRAFRLKITENGKFKCPLDEEFLLRFLRVRKFNVEDAFKHFTYFCKAYTKWPLIYKAKPSEIVQRLFQPGFATLLPDKDEDGAAIMFFDIGKWDPSISSADDILSGFIILGEIIMQDPVNQVTGVNMIATYKGFDFYRARHFTLPLLYRSAELVQHGLSLRFKAFHLININKYLELIMFVFLRLLPKKLRDRFAYYGSDLTELYKIFPQSILPEVIGGLKSDSEIVNGFAQKILNEEQAIIDATNIDYKATK